MAFVPIVVPNRRNTSNRRGSAGGIFAAVILLFIFGILFFAFFNRFDGFIPPIWLIFSGFGVFLIIIAVFATIAASMSSTHKKTEEFYIKSNQYQTQTQSQQLNPYIIRNSIPKRSSEPIKQEIEPEIPVATTINYCRFCGSKIDRDAVFCHMCGSKL